MLKKFMRLAGWCTLASAILVVYLFDPVLFFNHPHTVGGWVRLLISALLLQWLFEPLGNFLARWPHRATIPS